MHGPIVVYLLIKIFLNKEKWSWYRVASRCGSARPTGQPHDLRRNTNCPKIIDQNLSVRGYGLVLVTLLGVAVLGWW